MVTFLQWLIFVVLAGAFLTAVVGNYYRLFKVFLTSMGTGMNFFTKYACGITAMFWGGIAGMLACLFAPVGIARLWYVPLVIDPGCAPLLVLMVVNRIRLGPGPLKYQGTPLDEEPPEERTVQEAEEGSTARN